MSPERLERIIKYYEEGGYIYSQNEYYHMFDWPSGRWCEMYSKKDGGVICFDPTIKVNLVSSE